MPKIPYFRAFGYKCFIDNNGEKNLRRFDARSAKGLLVRYSHQSKAYRVYKKRT